MQSVRIWFSSDQGDVSIETLKSFLASQFGCAVVETEWRAGEYVVPQLSITSPVQFLLQIENEEWVKEEAEEFAEMYQDSVAASKLSELRNADARIAIGNNDPPAEAVGDQLVAFAGWTHVDPSDARTATILQAVALHVNGVLEDNVNGRIWGGPTEGVGSSG